MQASNKAQLAIDDRPDSFSIDEVDGKSILRLFIPGNQHSTQHYQRLNAWLKSEYAIEGQIGNGLSFTLPAEVFILSIAMLSNRFIDSKEPYKFLPLARLAVKLFPQASDTLIKILQARYASDLTRYYDLIDLGVMLEVELTPLTLMLDNEGKSQKDHCRSILSNIVQLQIGSCDLCRNILSKARIRSDICNEMAYRATLAVEAMTKAAQLHPEEFLCVLHACFNGNTRVLQEMQLLVKTDIVKYLDFFDLPSRPIINNCFTKNYANFKKQNYMEFINKKKEIAANSDFYDIFNINNLFFQKLSSRANQLTSAYNAAELILNNYDILTSYLSELACIISPLLPEKSQLSHPLFHKYNSCESPLIAAIHDSSLDHERNLQLFKELAVNKKYNQRTLNIELEGTGEKSLTREVMAPLTHAIQYACPAVARILLTMNTNVHAEDRRGGLLSYAMRRGNLEIVKLLIEFGANVMVVSEKGKTTPLHSAQNVECTRWFIEYVEAMSIRDPAINFATFINAQDIIGNTPLHVLARTNISYTETANYNTLDYAEKHAKRLLPLMQVFIDKNADVNKVNMYGYTALHYALKLKTDTQNEKIHLPTVMAKVKILCDAGTDVNIVAFSREVKDFDSIFKHIFPSMTPLLIVNDNSYLAHKSLVTSSSDKVYLNQIAEILVGRGARINIFDKNSLAPLHKALQIYCPATVKLFLLNGGNPNIRKNKKYPTPLHICLSEIKKNKSIVNLIKCLELLLHAGANPRLCMLVKLNIQLESMDPKSYRAIGTHTMQLILKGENIIANQAAALPMLETHEPIQERFLRVWSSLGAQAIDLSLEMNPLQYMLHGQEGHHHPRAIALFESWLTFYNSKDVMALIKVLCLSPLWVNIPKDLFALIASNFSKDEMQVQRLAEWLIEGRKLPKPQALTTEVIRAQRARTELRFFDKNEKLRRKIYEDFITQNRHNDPDIQNAYDKRFGLIGNSI